MPRKSTNSKKLSQSQPPQEFEVYANVEEQVNDLVRYFVNRAGEHVLFKRAELKKNVLPSSENNFQEIFNQAVKILKQVYGFNVIVVDPKQTATKSYIVSNALPYIVDPTEVILPDEHPSDANKVLILLILSHIFMSNNSVSDNSLYAFLESLGIDAERKHPVLGHVKDLINGTLKNKKYVNVETDQMSKKVTLSWGARAEKEISKHEILKFVCKMYKSTMPSSWITQYKDANAQDLENEQNLNAIQQPTQE